MDVPFVLKEFLLAEETIDFKELWLLGVSLVFKELLLLKEPLVTEVPLVFTELLDLQSLLSSSKKLL